MNTTIAAVGAIASIIGILAFFFPLLGPGILARIPIFPRYNWARVLAEVEEAQHRVYILQTWFPTLRLELPRWQNAIERPGVEFRVLIADQNLVPFRLRTREAVSGLTIQNVEDIRNFITQLAKEQRARFNVKFFNALPFGPIYVIDSYVYWGIYLSHADSMRGPSFRTRLGSKLGQQILGSFDALWQTGHHRSGALSFRDAPRDRQVDHISEVTQFNSFRLKLRGIFSLTHDTKEALICGSRFICFLRHGETDLNSGDIITGGLGVGVNSIGRKSIEEFRNEIAGVNWARVFSSPNRRCTETLIALIPNEKDRIEIREELKERLMGDLEGFSRRTFFESLPQYKGQDIFRAFHSNTNGGEAHCNVVMRTYEFLSEVLISVDSTMPVLVCAHDTTIRSIIYLLSNINEDQYSDIEVPFVKPTYLCFKMS